MRQKAICISFKCFGILCLIGLILLASYSGASAKEVNPIKIGFLLSLTGPQAKVAQEAKQTMEMFFDEIGWKIAGRKIEVITEDCASNPGVGLAKARKLVKHDKVNILTGFILSHIAAAVRDYVDSNKVPTLISIWASTPGLSFERKSDYILRSSPIIGHHAYGQAKYALEAGYKTGIIVAADFIAGHDFARVIKGVFEEGGGKIVQEIFVPMGTPDYSPYLLRLTKADSVFSMIIGFDTMNFMKSYAEFGYKDRMTLIGEDASGRPELISSVGDKILGTFYSGNCPRFDHPETPATKKFAEGFMSKYGYQPHSTGANTYVGFQVIKKAIEATQGNIEDVAKFMDAMKKVEFESVLGPFRFEQETNNAIYNIYVYRYDKKDGKIEGTLMRTYQGVKASDLRPYLIKK